MQYKTKQLKLQVLREVQIDNPLLDNPQRIANYFDLVIAKDSHLNLEVENFFVLYFNVRRRIVGYSHIAMGTLDSVLVSPRSVFVGAIAANAGSIILIHNHPSGDSTPSDADIKITKELQRGAVILKIDLIDHVIMGEKGENNPRGYHSLRELGYLY